MLSITATQHRRGDPQGDVTGSRGRRIFSVTANLGARASGSDSQWEGEEILPGGPDSESWDSGLPLPEWRGAGKLVWREPLPKPPACGPCPLPAAPPVVP